MKASIPVGIQPGTKILQLEYQETEESWSNLAGAEIIPASGHWKLWLHHDKLMRWGTYLLLYADGTIERITIGQNGDETTDRIR